MFLMKQVKRYYVPAWNFANNQQLLDKFPCTNEGYELVISS